MTPAAIRLVSQLRHEFYAGFAAAMQVPVSITSENSSASNPSMAYWVDQQQRLNYVRIYAHTAPDELVPDRPFVLRLAINKSADSAATARRERGSQGLNQSWHFELTLLPEEVLAFQPWIVSLVQSYEKGSTSFVQEPPYPLEFKTSSTLLSQHAWTRSADSSLDQSGESQLREFKLSSFKPSDSQTGKLIPEFFRRQ
jgi:hypothetical protein